MDCQIIGPTPSLVKQYYDDMLNGTYPFDSLKGRIGGYVDGQGRYMIGEGHHRMRAAIQSGVDANVTKLIENGRWTPVDVFPMKPVKLPK